jgi:subtilisin family serine protease
MPFNQEIKGDPFQGDFPDWYGEEPQGPVAAAVQREVDELIKLRFEPAARHEYLRVLQGRRAAVAPGRYGKGPRDDVITPFDFLPVEVGFDTLLVPGELLITRQSYDGSQGPVGLEAPYRYGKDVLDDYRLEARQVDCPALRDRVLRLVPTQPMGSQELADTARALRAEGLDASLCYITTLAGVVKPPPKKSSSGGAARTAFRVGEARRAGGGADRPVKVAIIDTGIAAKIRPDGWLADVPRDGNIDPLDTFPLPNGDGFLDFAAGHGTFVAGLVQEVAPGADIGVYRAVDSDGIGREVTVACALIRAVIEDGAQIVNLSLGCQTQDNVPPVAIQAALEIISEWAQKNDRDVLIVAAAGNSGDTTPSWPAAFSTAAAPITPASPVVVSVAGLKPDMQPAPWSTRGYWVTCSTIGQGLLSTYVEGRDAPPPDGSGQAFGADSWVRWSGTSFAAPQITGALALRYQAGGISLRAALNGLLAAGLPVTGFGRAVKILPGI